MKPLLKKLARRFCGHAERVAELEERLLAQSGDIEVMADALPVSIMHKGLVFDLRFKRVKTKKGAFIWMGKYWRHSKKDPPNTAFDSASDTFRGLIIELRRQLVKAGIIH